uniref:Uncharacterized protein n=1 Tax=Tetranychus urticae TaxID=32264 RepID=T1KXM0_TETUR
MRSLVSGPQREALESLHKIVLRETSSPLLFETNAII